MVECSPAPPADDALVEADVLPLRPVAPGGPLPSEPAMRAWVADIARRLRWASGLSPDAWAARWSQAAGERITPELVAVWEDPKGSKPLAHWLFLGALLAGVPLVEVLSGPSA